MASTVAAATDADELRGCEGAAAAAYFGALAGELGEQWGFRKRVRRPPTDPVNALLSFGYTLATAEMTRHVVRAGLDPRVGLLHGLRYGRESLPLDLVEEFRVPLVDRFTLTLLRRRQLVAADFEAGEGGAVRLTDAARRRYLEVWEERLQSRAVGLRQGEAEDEGLDIAVGRDGEELAQPTWRRLMMRQVRRLCRTFLYSEAYAGLFSQTAASGSENRPNTRQNGSHRPVSDDKDLE